MHAHFVGDKIRIIQPTIDEISCCHCCYRKVETHFPGPAIRAMQSLWLESSAKGTPPIQITIIQNGKQLVKVTGFGKNLLKTKVNTYAQEGMKLN